MPSNALSDIGLITIGLAWLAATAILFVYFLPRGGKYNRFVGTALEPLIGVAFPTGLVLSFAMIISAILDMMG